MLVIRDFIGLVSDGMRSNRLLWVLISGFALFPIYTHFADLPFWNDVAMRIMLLGIAAMGLNLVLGYGGMVSFGHAAFVGIGAYCAGISQFYGITNGWAHLGFSIATCGFAGLVIGYLALRTTNEQSFCDLRQAAQPGPCTRPSKPLKLKTQD